MDIFRLPSKLKRLYFIEIILVLAPISILSIINPSKGLCQNSGGLERVERRQKESETGDQIIIQVGDMVIKAVDLKEYLSYRPLPSSSVVTDEILTQRMDEIITSEALYQEALRLNLDQEPGVRRTIQQILIQKLLQEKVEDYVWNRLIEEKELQDYYNKNKDHFNRAEQVRLADIFIEVGPKASQQERNKKRGKAESCLAEALKKGQGQYNFGELIKQYSDKHPKYPKGDTTFFDAEGKPVGLDKKLAEEAFKLKRTGEICDHVIETEEGFHIIMLVQKRPAIHRHIDEVKSLIERRIRREELERTREDYIRKVKESINIKKNDQAVVELFKEIKETLAEESQQKTDKSLPTRYRNMHVPPLFPGEVD